MKALIILGACVLYIALGIITAIAVDRIDRIEKDERLALAFIVFFWPLFWPIFIIDFMFEKIGELAYCWLDAAREMRKNGRNDYRADEHATGRFPSQPKGLIKTDDLGLFSYQVKQRALNYYSMIENLSEDMK